jgi:ferric-dicitrate binding protein FerR (iron transport regulator)
VANITASGSSVLVLPNASITFVGPGVELTRGGISVTTSEEITVSSYGLIFTPAERRQSKFEVVEYQDSVIVAARQGNVIVADGQQTSMVPEGQESTHKKKKGGDMPAP